MSKTGTSPDISTVIFAFCRWVTAATSPSWPSPTERTHAFARFWVHSSPHAAAGLMEASIRCPTKTAAPPSESFFSGVFSAACRASEPVPPSSDDASEDGDPLFGGSGAL